jgi:GGDEF domain-containing protein
MPLISIRRYLDQFKPERETAPGLSVHAAACTVLATEVDARLLCDDSYAKLRPQWGELAHLVDQMESPADLAAFQAKASAVLAERHRQEALREQAQGRDVRQMLGVLNEALLTLASGNEGSVDRLRRVEAALHRTSQLNDLVAMKASLTETMRLVREETEQTRTEGAASLQRLDSELQKARSASQHLPGLPGRDEALRALRNAAQAGAPPWLAVACQLERLRIIRSRYGVPIADELLLAFAQSTAAPETDQIFRWSEDALVILRNTGESLQEVRDRMEDHFARPFEHRVMTGGRAALLSVAVRWLCISPAEPATPKVEPELELFLDGRR